MSGRWLRESPLGKCWVEGAKGHTGIDIGWASKCLSSEIERVFWARGIDLLLLDMSETWSSGRIVGDVIREIVEKVGTWKHMFSKVGEEEKIQMKHKRTRIVMFYQSQMRKDRKKRKGIDCVKCGWEVKKDECWVKFIHRFDDKEVTSIRSVGGRMEPYCVGLRSDE